MSILDKSKIGWESISAIQPDDLLTTREQLHHAVQLIAAAGKYLIPERPDDSHTSMNWNEENQTFEGETISGNEPVVVGIRPFDFTLYIGNNDFSLMDKTKDQAFSWMADQLSGFGIDVSNLSMKMHYEIPSEAFQEGEPFRISNADSLKEISRYYANANRLLQIVRNDLEGASQVRCWPHHFDIASLFTIDTDKPAEEARSIGFGFSPGDDSYKEPYFYITPWPYPDLKDIALPDLKAGKWRTTGWFGVVLEASDIYSQNDQETIVIDFINSAIPASATLLNYKLT